MSEETRVMDRKRRRTSTHGWVIAAVIVLIAFAMVRQPGAAPDSPPAAEENAETDAKPIDGILAEFGVTRDDLGPDTAGLLLQSRRRLSSPITIRLLLHPLDVPYVAGHLAANYRRWSFSIVRTVLQLVAQTPADLARGYLGNPLRDWDDRLVEADDPLLAGAQAVWEAAREKKADAMPDEARVAWVAASDGLSAAWRREIGRLLMAEASAAQWQRRAFAALDEPARALLNQASLQGLERDDDLRPVIEQTDFDYLYAGAMDLAVAAEDFLDFLDSNPAPFSGSFDLDTPLGRVALRGGASDDELNPEEGAHYLLVLDLGGNDTYGAGMNRGGYDYPVQMLFDLDGNDRYVTESPLHPSWGGAFAGYGLLVDRAGNDEYQGVLASQGAAVLGAGMLFDQAGNDRYTAFGFAQGAGHAGIGILQDRAGDDRYEALTRAQGCGDSLGAGTLLEEAGNDRYILNDEIIRVPSPQSSEHNASMGQGTGVGLRADLSDGHSVPGGVGILYDLAGDDEYSAGVFAQGCGYLGGTGMLMDDAGTDTLKAAYYAQGASAHRGVGVLINRGGNDTYEVSIQCAQGCGHDLGVGWLLDTDGNDRYHAFRLAQGAANENGWGFCIDFAGDDAYRIDASPASADSRGAAKLSKWGTLREDLPALGLFLDAGGRDTYTGVPSARDNAKWTYPRRYVSESFQSERGAGWDGEFPAVDLRTGPLTPFPQSEFDDCAAQQRLRRQYRKGRKD